MSPLNPLRPPPWMAALGEHDAPGLFERPAPPSPLSVLHKHGARSLSPLSLPGPSSPPCTPCTPSACTRAPAKPRRPDAELARIEHHVCALDSPCP